MWYVLFAILLFGILIIVHELGHFLTARLFHVTIREFSIGMGPKLVWGQSKKSGTLYALRALPIGGYVSMLGEDEASDDEGSFSGKPVWQRFLITAAGSFSNLLLGFLIMAFLVFSMEHIYSPTVTSFGAKATSNAEGGLEVGDTLIRVGPRRVHTANDMIYAIGRYGTEPVDLIVLRNGEKMKLEDVVFPTYTEQGIVFGDRDFNVRGTDRNVFTLLRHTWYQSTMTVRMVYDSLGDLLTGKYGIKEVSGPVGVTQVITETAKSKDFDNLLYLFVVLAINLGIMNLLPFPALDGGRLVFQLWEWITKKPVKPEIEGYIHFAGILILLAFMAIISVKDIIYLFR
ncbi:MAG: site-2 protease family protein [Ruminococcus sp.]|nr:site-2 protease family protein [Candidatus Apopatosoma intestinale]